MSDNDLKTVEEANDYRAEVARDVWGDESIKPATIERSEEEQEQIEQRTTEQQEEEQEVAVLPPEVKAMLERFEKTLGNIDYRVKQTESRIGSVQNAVQNQMAAAKHAAQVVTDAPSKEEIANAAKSDEKWNKLKDQYPEWSEVMDGLEERIAAKSAKAPDMSAIKAGIRAELATDFDTKLTQQQKSFEVRLVSFAHRDWKEVVRSPKWDNWLAAQSPEMQQLAQSENADEAIYVLDAFKASQEEVQETPEEIEARRKKQLSRSQTVRTTTKQPRATNPDDMTPAEYRAFIAKDIWGESP